ncbi:hypothetical protein [Aquibium microcysteis]|uniref:hypothetical protein n=1 Tax=Aquibium microcysteis TaxID=675281 RepID=UPI00165CF7F4|nr:hypothetical protein [Aquibium microcysteis]
MIANAIAYFLAALFFGIGIHGLARVGLDRVPVEKEGTHILTAFIFLVLAFVWAKLGGI